MTMKTNIIILFMEVILYFTSHLSVYTDFKLFFLSKT